MRARHDWTEHVRRLEMAERQILARAPPARTKYRNAPVIVDGYRFDSKLEADRYQELKLLKASGEVEWFLRQVPFHLAPAVTWRADFLVIWRDRAERVTAEDAKGFLTDTARVKLALVRERYGVDVRILRRADVRRST